ncbi:hypothetical protein GCM10022255_112030 [Dactylosporangium darangshiense]|uniref:Knr4/Smi1-like domain-containing protein n=1 Tax=Dactylosporangium darangshiense TaxID=579108 RepID=A0ABP8DUZ1_9ACTN
MLPPALRTLYRATDGVFDKLGQWFVNWPLERMAEEHHHAWTDAPMARRQLLGFGNDGTGAPFCVPSDGSDGVFVWNHIDQQTYRLAGTVEEFLGERRPLVERHRRVELTNRAVVGLHVNMEHPGLVRVGQRQQPPRRRQDLLVASGAGLGQSVADAGTPHTRLGLISIQRLHRLDVEAAETMLEQRFQSLVRVADRRRRGVLDTRTRTGG